VKTNKMKKSVYRELIIEVFADRSTSETLIPQQSLPERIRFQGSLAAFGMGTDAHEAKT
jgi:hypothetical protein|tara:strand:- start:3132 stop:3308 length:177 start_codon:yes stop_codon:yes gene_type:complete